MNMNELEKIKIAQLIDHTNLQNNLTLEDIEKICKEAIDYGFHSVCLQPFYISYALDYLKHTRVKLTSVAAFPYGTQSTDTKIEEVSYLIKNKIDEIDCVMNVSAFLMKEYAFVGEELTKIAELCRASNVLLKVIIETGLLMPEEIAKATRIVCKSGADYVKTSTGVVSRGVSLEDIIIIKENISGDVKVKASGGIRSLQEIRYFIEAGCDRIGTSQAVKILSELEK